MILGISLAYIALMLLFRGSKPVQAALSGVLLVLAAVWMADLLRESLTHYRSRRSRGLRDLHDAARFALGALSAIAGLALLLEGQPPRFGWLLTALIALWGACYLTVLGMAIALGARTRRGPSHGQ
ncbi:MAG TPA: hypothetical protein VFN71_01855 [Methylomirabilota bacterium]|nr:hypothetical protein [Methylomirabilota bacterium]